MKLSATIGALLAATLLVSASAATASALITETYDGDFDAAYLHVTNIGSGSFTSIAISGGDNGGSASFTNIGVGTTVDFALGDNEYDFPGSQGTALVTIVRNGRTFSGSFTDVIGDPDFNVGPVTLGTLGTVPEPAAWGMMLTGFGLLGATMRRSRATTVAA
nr:PEPxxWA-CTERM sorting domain-containing protein [Polymorphobacter sp.]